jgi:hypothetical protein
MAVQNLRRRAEIEVKVNFSKEEDAVSLTVDPEEKEQSHGEKCSCKRCWCGSCVPANKRCCRISHVIESKNVESVWKWGLKIVWKWGLKIVSSAVFPIFCAKGYIREVYTLVLAILSFVLAFPTLIDHLKNKTGNPAIEVILFVVSFLSVVLASVDMVFTFYNSGWRVRKAGKAICCALWTRKTQYCTLFSRIGCGVRIKKI